jgi:hypothetical protein
LTTNTGAVGADEGIATGTKTGVVSGIEIAAGCDVSPETLVP